MNNLVFIASGYCKDAPYTTPATIADNAQVSIATLESHYRGHYVGFCKHIPSLRRKDYRYYEYVMPERFSEAQALLMLSLLKNTELVQGLRFELIQQFNGANKELAVRREQKRSYNLAKEECTALMCKKGLSASVQAAFTGLTYVMAFDKDMRTVRRENHVPASGRTIDYMSADDLFALTVAQEELTELLHTGKSYEAIAAIVMPQSEPMAQQPAFHSDASEKADMDKVRKELLEKMLRSLCA